MAITWTRDEIILACALVKKHNWRGLDDTHPEVQELSALLQAAPIHPVEERDEKFRNPNGVGRKTWDIATQHPEYTGVPTRGNKLDRVVLEEFLEEPGRMVAVAEAIRAVILSGDAPPIPEDEIEMEDISEDEGRLLVAKHLRRERSPRLRKAKIVQVKKQGKSIACEVCDFDFGQRYGPIGDDYIEVHHVLPLHASGPTQTRLQDLALLCANCHRMIHRTKPWLTPASLKGHLR
jgi:5-methylcytosine-specific restriction protein A